MEKYNDLKAVLELKKGKTNTMEYFIDKYGNVLKKHAFLLCGNNDFAEELVQETFIGFYYGIVNFREEASVKTYLLKILYNKYLHEKRKVWRIKEININEHNYEMRKEDFSNNIDMKIFVHNSLKKLKPKQREILILKYFEDLTVKQISKIINKSESAVKINLKRAREKLKLIVEGEESYDIEQIKKSYGKTN